MKTKVLLAVVALSCAPLVVAGDEAAYPKEKVAAFGIDKLDLTSLPSTLRPKKEKRKKTFAYYGFTAQRVDESEAVLEAAGGVRRLVIKVLDQKSSGIYVCVAEPGENGGSAKTQSVIVLKSSRIYCMPSGWRKRLNFELVRGLRSYIERPCSNKV